MGPFARILPRSVQGRRDGLLALLMGIAMIAAAHAWAAPRVTPLYDGVIVEEPYRYLHPPADANGDPKSISDRIDVSGSDSPNIAESTGEVTPQAQLIVQQGALDLPAGTTSLTVSISPVEPAGNLPAGIAGNAYRISLTTPDGQTPAFLAGASGTVVLRAPVAVQDGVIYRSTPEGWVPLSTTNGGQGDLFATNVSELGDFVLVSTTAATPAPTNGGFHAAPDSTGGGLSPLVFVAIGLGLAAIAFFAAALGINRRQP